MVHKRSVVAGFFAGGIILALGLALIFSKDWAWSLFETFYSMLGIQAQRRRLLEMFITTIGLGISVVGVYLILSAWQRWRLGR